MLPEETREHTVETAEQRLWTFGFKKTTIDEIATDVYVGNQFYESKEVIVLATIAQRKRALLQEQIAPRQNISFSPAEKLRHMVKFPILDAHRRFKKHMKVRMYATAGRCSERAASLFFEKQCRNVA
jgi:AcrR family transcriptional regulator